MKRNLIALLLIVAGLFAVYFSLQLPKASAQANYTLTVNSSTVSLTNDLNNDQAGQNAALATVTSSPAGINCGQGHNQCSAQFAAGTSITLTGTVFNNRSDITFQWSLATSQFHAQAILSSLHCAGEDNTTGYVPGQHLYGYNALK